MQKCVLYLLFIAVVTITNPAIVARTADDPLSDYPQFVEDRLREWGVPGAAVGVIKDGNIIFKRGFGLRDKENNLPVDPDTLFGIGSCSKAFTAMSAAIAVEEGILDYDTPIITWLPDFKLKDPYATANVTLRDLLYHRTGMSRHDLFSHGTSYSRDELINRYRYLDIKGNFRERYIYSNLMYILAGHLVGKAGGMEWEEYVTEKILKPLYMTRTYFSFEQMTAQPNYAHPYVKDSSNLAGECFPAEMREWKTNAPAGGVVSNLNDMLAWLQLHLARGKTETGEVLSDRGFTRLVIPAMGRYYAHGGPILTGATAMGWNVYLYRGHYLVMHTGIISGYCSAVAFLPEENIGVVVLTNMKMHSLQEILSYNAIDRMLGLDQFDWNAQYRYVWDDIEKYNRQATADLMATRKTGTTPSLSINEYTGRYEHPALGAILVSEDGSGGLTAEFNGRVTVILNHFHYDTWLSSHQKSIEFNELTFQFLMDVSGAVKSLKIDQGENMDEVEFTKSAPAS